MASTYTLLADLRAGRCSNTAKVRLLSTAEVRLLSTAEHRVGVYLCKYFTINLMNKFQGILSFVHGTVWKVLFGKVADSLGKGTEHEDEYMISEKELLVNSCNKQLKRFTEEFGPEWAMQHLVPQCKEVLDIVTNPHYLHRMMVLRAISLMAPVMGSEITCSKFLLVVAEASKDKVPNVKFNVAKLLQSLIPIVDQSVVEKTIRQCLVDLSEDPDVDFRYFANQAICSIDDAAAVQS
uniref:Condensin complex subunit 1 C-terminal domain-containing protein n=1 Tax=Brassica oleracea var. oleracea TaxID=109376 RepID=A0A0D3B1K8_BRAOL